MLFGLLVTLFVILCVLLVLIILVQKGKGSTGLGGLGGSTQMLFGGSGGQDIFQKITWAFTAIFLFGSLALALMKSSRSVESRYLRQQPVRESGVPTTPAGSPSLPEDSLPTDVYEGDTEPGA